MHEIGSKILFIGLYIDLEEAEIRHEGTLIAVTKKRKEYPAKIAALLGKTTRLQKNTVVSRHSLKIISIVCTSNFCCFTVIFKKNNDCMSFLHNLASIIFSLFIFHTSINFYWSHSNHVTHLHTLHTYIFN